MYVVYHASANQKYKTLPEDIAIKKSVALTKRPQNNIIDAISVTKNHRPIARIDTTGHFKPTHAGKPTSLLMTPL